MLKSDYSFLWKSSSAEGRKPSLHSSTKLGDWRNKNYFTWLLTSSAYTSARFPCYYHIPTMKKVSFFLFHRQRHTPPTLHHSRLKGSFREVQTLFLVVHSAMQFFLLDLSFIRGLASFFSFKDKRCSKINKNTKILLEKHCQAGQSPIR